MEEKPEERIRQISSKSAEYPQKLNNYPKMPEILFVKRKPAGCEEADSSDRRRQGVQPVWENPGFSLCKDPE